MMKMKKSEYVSGQWVGKDGKNYRTVKFWVTEGWTAGFMQVNDNGNWMFI